MVFFLPAAVDITLIGLVSRQRELLWISPLLATAGSLVGSYVTYTIGRKIGEKSLGRWISERRLKAVESRIKNKGALALAIPGLMPPPFPLTPFVLACGALNVRPAPAFLTLGIARLLRFSIAAGLAAVYGTRILAILDSPVFKGVIAGFIVVSLVGTVLVAFRLIRTTRNMKSRPAT
jgi:membrane protein YqaA with SNARE-associated domain